MTELIIATKTDLEDIIFKAVLKSYNDLKLAKQSTPAPEPRYLYSIRELAAFLQCSTVKAQNLKNSGKIRYYQDGRKVWFREDWVLEDLQKNTK